MKEIQSKLEQMIEQLERSIEKADSINKKLDILLEAMTVAREKGYELKPVATPKKISYRLLKLKKQ